MTKKVLALMLALSMSVGIVLSGCDNSGSTSSTGGDSTSSAGGSDASESTEVGTFEDIEFPDELPKEIVMGDGLDYSYDDLTEKYTIEIISTNYGAAALPAADDVVNQWLSKKFNMDITLTAPTGEDYQTVLSTRFASNDYPDIIQLPSREYGFNMSDQGLLLDAKNIYPYLLLSNNYTTKNMIKWSTNSSNGELPFITKYAIQDGTWGFIVRQDWLDALDMEWPTTKDEVLEFAKGVTFDDPDGNGKADTYFMTGGGEGKGYGMLGGFETMFGNPSVHVEDGALVHPYFDGTRKGFISFLKELNDAGVLAPDWFTKTWDQSWGDASNDMIAMCWFPAGTFEMQVVTKNMEDTNVENFKKWAYYQEVPIEGGKYGANGNPGYMWAFTKEKFDGQDGKIKRVAHMIDTMTMGGENYFQTIQGSIPEVYEAAGVEVNAEGKVWGYTDDNKSFYISEVGDKMLDSDQSDFHAPNGIWQMWGLCTSYQIDYEDPEADEFNQERVKSGNAGRTVINSYDRWPNDGLLVTLTGEAAEASVSNTDWILAQEYAFITGSRSLDEWDAYTQEWLDKGGKLIIQQSAEQLGVEVPDYAK